MSISGNLRTMPFADLLQWVSQSRKTGTLSVEGEPHNKKIYFRDGLIAAAGSLYFVTEDGSIVCYRNK